MKTAMCNNGCRSSSVYLKISGPFQLNFGASHSCVGASVKRRTGVSHTVEQAYPTRRTLVCLLLDVHDGIDDDLQSKVALADDEALVKRPVGYKIRAPHAKGCSR